MSESVKIYTFKGDSESEPTLEIWHWSISNMPYEVIHRDPISGIGSSAAVFEMESEAMSYVMNARKEAEELTEERRKKEACNDHLAELLESQARLTQSVLSAIRESDYERARLFSSSAERCAKDVSSFLNSMIEAEWKV